MALAVDRVDLLAREVLALFSSFRDGLAVIGACYAAKRTLELSLSVYGALKAHAVARCIQTDLVKRYGPWAVVTGSTHGIGKAFAQELASFGLNIVVVSLNDMDCSQTTSNLVVTGCTHGIGRAVSHQIAQQGGNIVLISRTESRVHEVAAEIEEQFGVKTIPVPVDFNEGKPVYEKIAEELEDLDIGILVNNVGVMYDYPDYFLEIPEDKLWQLVQVNVAAATMMTHMVLPGMKERGRGAIITVSSGTSSLPTPQMAVYSATTAYLDSFTRALSYEYRPCGITVQCLMPFYVATRLTQYSSTLANPSLLIPSATTYARHALATLGWCDRTTGYWPHTLQLWIANMIPESLWMWGASRLNSALRRQAQHRIRRRSRHRSGSILPSSRSSSRRGSMIFAAELVTADGDSKTKS